MLFSFEESLLLSELEQKPTLHELSLKLGKDPSVISRLLTRMAQKSPVIEKMNGKWVLTKKGSELALWAKKVYLEQNDILEQDYSLTIATTREFAGRILAPQFETFLKSRVKFSIITCEDGIENALLKGMADFGFDCGRPNDPAIAFKQVIEEKIITVASSSFVQKTKIKDVTDLKDGDFFNYSRIKTYPHRNIDLNQAKASSNDISVIRSLLLSQSGWATLPYYAVKEELKSGKLKLIPEGEIKGYKFGVWWLRGRESLLPWIKLAENWLDQQDLTDIPKIKKRN